MLILKLIQFDIGYLRPRYRKARVATINMFNGNKCKAGIWFVHNHSSLGGISPLEACKTAVGAQEVLYLIGRVINGV